MSLVNNFTIVYSNSEIALQELKQEPEQFGPQVTLWLML